MLQVVVSFKIPIILNFGKVENSKTGLMGGAKGYQKGEEASKSAGKFFRNLEGEEASKSAGKYGNLEGEEPSKSPGKFFRNLFPVTHYS